jgi:hypothetical protein
MYNSFRDALAVEMREEIDKVEVLEQKGTILANTLCLVRMLLSLAAEHLQKNIKLTGYGTPFDVA